MIPDARSVVTARRRQFAGRRMSAYMENQAQRNLLMNLKALLYVRDSFEKETAVARSVRDMRTLGNGSTMTARSRSHQSSEEGYAPKAARLIWTPQSGPVGIVESCSAYMVYPTDRS